jgi:hypothetical protein
MLNLWGEIKGIGPALFMLGFAAAASFLRLMNPSQPFGL